MARALDARLFLAILILVPLTAHKKSCGVAMGFATENLLTSDQLVQEFLCPICVMLVEQPVITTCRWCSECPCPAFARDAFVVLSGLPGSA